MSKYSNKSNNDINYFYGILLICILAFIPLIIKIAIVPTADLELQYLRSANQVNDIFSYHKSIAIIICAVLVVFSVALDFFAGSKFKIWGFNKLQYICIGVFLFMVIISSIFSKYGFIVTHGVGERYESIWVLFSYIIFMFVATQFCQNVSSLKWIVFGICLSALFVGGLGAFQAFGLDYANTDIAKKIILGKYYADVKDFQVKFATSYSTLYNPNCLGLYSSLMFPFFTVLAAMMPFKSKFKYIFAILALISLFSLIGSDSFGGLIGTICSFTALFIIGISYCFYNKKYVKAASALLAVSLIILIGFVGIYFANSTFKEKINHTVEIKFNINTESPYFYKDLALNENSIILSTTAAGQIKIDYDNIEHTLTAYNNAGDVVQPLIEAVENNPDTKIYNYEGLGTYQPVKIQMDNEQIIYVDSKIVFMFQIVDGKLVALTKKGQFVDINAPVPSVGFEGLERAASSRGYIWSRSIPVAFEHFLIGSGPDTFAFEFPQYDIVGKVRYLGDPYIITDKPHSIFLQQSINTGLLSLIALLVLFGSYICGALKGIVKNKSESFVWIVKIAILAGIIGYLVTGLTTDSVVSVAPVFWVILGTGIAVNKL